MDKGKIRFAHRLVLLYKAALYVDKTERSVGVLWC